VPKATAREGWLAELERASKALPRPDGYFTTQEWARATGHDVKWVLAKLTELNRLGRLAMVKVRETRLDGVPTVKAAYKILPEKRKK
jgi:hypothetical protein